jgi:cytochrome c2
MAASLEVNKVLAAILTAGIIASGTGVVSRMIFHPRAPEKNAYPIEVTEAAGGGAKAAKEEAAPPIAVLLASASAEKGATIAKACHACHNLGKGDPNKIGPHLYDVLGRDIASISDFSYSDALKKIGGKWDYDKLNEFLTSPKAFAPGTKMTFIGLKKPEDRADVILYLRSLADSPEPLPAPPPATAAAPAGQQPTAQKEAAATPAKAQPAGQKPAAQAQPAEQKQAAETPAPAPSAEQKPAAATAAQAQPTEQKPAAETPAQAQPAEQKQAAEAPAQAQTAEQKPAAETAAQAQPAEQQAAAEPAQAGGQPAAAGGDFGQLLAAADPAQGEHDAKICKACHNFEAGAGNKIGPDLHGVVGRKIASVEGFTYSSALQGKEGVWDYDKLNEFLTSPRAFAPGTKMTFVGLKKPEQRAAVIAYLRSITDNPPPLPGKS